MDRSPHVTAFNRTERLKFAAHVALFNAYLADYVDALPAKYSDASALLFDTHAAVGAVLDAPESYGFKDSTGWCGAYAELVMEPEAFEEECEWPLREYAWYDSYHLSWKAQEDLGKTVGDVSYDLLVWRPCRTSPFRLMLRAALTTRLVSSRRLFPSRPRPSASASAGTRSRPAGSGPAGSPGRCRATSLAGPPAPPPPYSFAVS